MPFLTELSLDELRVAGDATETLIDLRAYLPPDGMLIMLAGRFRDDIREELRMKPLAHASRGSERKTLDDLTAQEATMLSKVVATLLDRFAPFMEDPELPKLLRELRQKLTVVVLERAHAAEEAKAS
jgi:hypothetical protein